MAIARKKDRKKTNSTDKAKSPEETVFVDNEDVITDL